MTLPPLIERELRGAARRGLTYWLRLLAAASGILVVMPFVLMIEIGARFGNAGIPPHQLGPILFGIFSAVACFTAVAAGWFFAVDAIAHERREGTLELLFLAPLKAWEVVLGKFFTVTWRGSQWLLAAIPLFALPILLGGVRGLDFVHLAGLTANTLFWSVATSLHASARCRGILEALVAAVVLQTLMLILPYAADLAIAGFAPSRFVPRLSLLSPAFGWFNGLAGRSPDLGTSLALVHVECWILLALTIRATARRIRQDPAQQQAPGIPAQLQEAWKFGGRGSRELFRKRLIDGAPIRWLVERERGPGRFLTALLLILATAVAAISIAAEEWTALYLSGSFATLVLSFAVAILLSLQACRFLVEARRNGALELLLVSPVSTRALLGQQVRSLVRTFAPAVVVLVAAQLAIAVGQMRMSAAATAMTAAAAPVAGSTPTPTPVAGSATAFLEMARYQWLNAAAGVFVTLVGQFAVAWIGFWMGVVCRQISLALLATLAITKIVPIFVLGFAQGTVLPLVLSQRVPPWFPALFTGALGVGFNLGLIALARYQLLPDLRVLLDSPALLRLPPWPVRRSRIPPVLTTK
ncbi:MAG: hypothetical protein AB7O66_02155 [Limisphaerales bacterium]